MSKIHMGFCAVVAICLISCSRPQDEAPVKIDAARMSAEEFNHLYKFSHPEDYPQDSVHRQEFLGEIINRKLMLLEAERMGLDRDPQFLREVQDFWQERLLKLVLQRKSEEYRSKVRVTPEEIKQYFEEHPEWFAGMTLQQSSDNIRQLLLQARQQAMMEEWLKALRTQAKITVDYSRLGIQP